MNGSAPEPLPLKAPKFDYVDDEPLPPCHRADHSGRTPLERLVEVDKKMDHLTLLLAMIVMVLMVNAVSLIILQMRH